MRLSDLILFTPSSTFLTGMCRTERHCTRKDSSWQWMTIRTVHQSGGYAAVAEDQALDPQDELSWLVVCRLMCNSAGVRSARRASE